MNIKNTTQTSFETKNTPSIETSCAVLVATYNGSEFLDAQFDSIRNQNVSDLKIFISDDGSMDSTHQIINNQSTLWRVDSFNVRNGPKTGFAENFMSLICASDINADYFAFADQDDIWETDKLSRAIKILEKLPSNTPVLYCSRSQLIDKAGRKIGFSPLFKKNPSFQNALVQCIAGGNTMLMNKAARNLIMQTKDTFGYSHDWWAYILVTGVGGTVFYDSHPTILYRQHSNNVYGRNNNWLGALHRIRLLFKGQLRHWNNLNCAALKNFSHLLTPENQQTLNTFSIARNQRLLPRMLGIWKSGIYRQTWLGNIGLFMAALFKKL